MVSSARQLRVVWDDSGPQRRLPPGSDPRAAWTLDQFLEEWVVGAVWRPKRTTSETIRGYLETLKYWRAISSDPPLGLATDQETIDFVGLLPEWGSSSRGVPRGKPHRIARLDECPSFEPLTSVTIANHATRLATLFRFAGPQLHPRKPAARIIKEFPYIPQVTREFETKPPFNLEVARQIASASGRMTKPDLPPGWPRALWWQLRLAIFYYTGIRAGTVLELAWKHVIPTVDGPAFTIPGSLVKTGKAVWMPLPAQLAALLATVPRGSPDDLILPAGCCYRHFVELHSELQRLAEVPEHLRQSPHAWRRTHLTQMVNLGSDQMLEVGRLAAQHADGRTTEKNYLGQAIVNQLRMRLPPLF